MEFQIGQCKMQKENQLAVLAGEVAYLNEHQVAHPPSPSIKCDQPHQSQPAPAIRVARRAHARSIYLRMPQVTVQRKSSELSSRMAEVEASTAAAQHKLQRVLHSNEMASADRRREMTGVTDDVAALGKRFEQVRSDMRQLYHDKLALHRQLETARAERRDVEECVARYRKSLGHVVGDT